MKILLLSAYAAHSHVHWQDSLRRMFPDWEWQVLSLPPRHFSWRIRGNPLHWSQAERECLNKPYDLLVATSMVDLATLRGLVPSLARLPSLLYFHENQFDYPQQDGQPSLLEAQMVSLYAALAADVLAFNSAFNRDTFLDGVDTLLRRLPDYVPAGIPALLAAKARILPVPVEMGRPDAARSHWPGTSQTGSRRPLRLVWSGRFEHDKGAESLWHTLLELEHSGLLFELALTGQQFRQSPAIFARIEREFAHRLVHCGYLPSRSDYRALLRGADLVLSTARHEFQGLAVLEAVACGCLPVVPDRLAYPEIYPTRFRYESHPLDAPREGACAAALIGELWREVGQGTVPCPDVSAFEPGQLRPRYRELLQQLVTSAG